MGKRERAVQADQAQAVPVNVGLGTARRDDLPGFAAASPDDEVEGVRPPNADRVLAQLRDLLGPLITALDAEPAPPEPAPSAPEPDDLVAVCGTGRIPYDAEEAW